MLARPSRGGHVNALFKTATLLAGGCWRRSSPSLCRSPAALARRNRSPATTNCPPPPPPPPQTGDCGTKTGPPATYAHVVWIWMENHSYSQIIGSLSAPYINSLASGCGLATNYKAVTHPSLPNYIAATSGGTWGIADDNPPSSHPLAVNSRHPMPNVSSSFRTHSSQGHTSAHWASSGAPSTRSSGRYRSSRFLATRGPDPCARLRRTRSGAHVLRRSRAPDRLDGGNSPGWLAPGSRRGRPRVVRSAIG
jgi:hypothetical protein